MRSIAQMEIQARCDRDEIRRLREENARLRLLATDWDAKAMKLAEVTVERLTRERDEERGHKEAYFKAGREAEAEVAALRQRVEELERALRAVHGDCPGWISVTGSAHDPRCDGTCSVGCPVPVEEQEQCQVCAALAAERGE